MAFDHFPHTGGEVKNDAHSELEFPSVKDGQAEPA